MALLFDQFIAWVEASKYILLFIGCIVEGPVLMVASGFLWRLGNFDFVPMYIALLSGDFAADLVWYGVGRTTARPLLYKYGKHFGITPAIVEKIEHRFHTYQNKILIISKLTMGFGFALVTLVVAGMLKVRFKNYVMLNLIGGFIWTLFLIGVGYFFGDIYESLSTEFKLAFAIVVAISVYLAFKFGSSILKKIEL
jgi:membrane protein DedA with SNARE-associated domain